MKIIDKMSAGELRGEVRTLRTRNEELETIYSAVVRYKVEFDSTSVSREMNARGDLFDLLDDDYDPTPWCHICGAMDQKDCDCGPYAENH